MAAKQQERRVILGLGISLDGYIARPDGAVDFLFMPKDYQPRMAAFMRRVDTAILGRKTYEVAQQMGGGHWGGMKAYVMTRTLPSGERNGFVFTHSSPSDLVQQVRKTPGKDIWMMGGGQLAREFLDADLIDELYLGIVPALIGKGIPLFPSSFPQREFTLVENETFSKGLIALKYERKRGKKVENS